MRISFRSIDDDISGVENFDGIHIKVSNTSLFNGTMKQEYLNYSL